MYELVKIAIALSCLLYASYHDMRTRLIPSWIWWIMGISALIFYGLDAYMNDGKMLIMLVPMGAVLIEALVERDDMRNLRETWPFFILYLSGFGVLLWGYSEYRHDIMFLGALSATAISVLFFALYYSNIIHGAADAKALVMISLMFYFYPFSSRTPLSVVFPFSLLVLFYASLTVALSPIYFLIRNMARGNMRFPEMLFGYPEDIENAQKKKVWPMVKVENGKIKRALMPPKYMDIDWKAIEDAGLKEVWVTPKIPFIVPITIGFVIALLTGNIFYP